MISVTNPGRDIEENLKMKMYLESKRTSQLSAQLKSGKRVTLHKGLNKLDKSEIDELEAMPAMKPYFEGKELVRRPEIACSENRKPKAAEAPKQPEPPSEPEAPSAPESSEDSEGSSVEESEGAE